MVAFGLGKGIDAGVTLMLAELLSVGNQVIIHIKLALAGDLVGRRLINHLHGLIRVKLMQKEASL